MEKVSIPLGCDCGGCDGPAEAWQSVARVLLHMGIVTLELEYDFVSEHPKAKDIHAYLWMNSKAKMCYSDMTQRREGAGQVVWSRERLPDSCALVNLPPKGRLLNYHNSFTCQDVSRRNINRPGMTFDVDDEDCLGDETQSTQTYFAGIQTIKQADPRTYTLENVGGCPVHQLVAHTDAELPDMKSVTFVLDAVDFGSRTSRVRMHIYIYIII